jgi:hypothetical protein
MRKLIDMVRDRRKARFVFFRDGALHYETEDGFIFPVPVTDAGSATFGREERAILLMRYIRKHLATVEAARRDEMHGGTV